MITAIAPRMARKRKRNLAVQWLLPYFDATEGGEAAMIRYLDDPDVPCFAEGWLKADKNRFHQERAPGMAKKYVFNPSSWVYAFKDSLTAVSVAQEWPYPGNSVPNQGWGSKRGATLITPRHIVMCGHGPFGPGTEAYPSRIRFAGTDGETYERVLIGTKNCLNNAGGITVNGVLLNGDSCVVTLDADLPPEVIPVRTIPNNFKFTWEYGAWPALFISQSIELDSPTPTQFGEQVNWYPTSGPFPATNYPRRHRSMCTSWASPKVSYNVWGGDSGMPLFYGYGTELLWAGFCGGGGSGPTQYPTIRSGVTITWEDLVSALIDGADDDAIARGIGDLTERTEYRCQFADEIPDLLPP